MTSLRIGTRGSQLALWQAGALARKLRDAGHEPEIVPIRTTGDKRHDVSLASIGGKGLFIREIEEALEARSIDLAVHSLKDVPSIVPAPFELAAFLEREDPRDVWVRADKVPIGRLPAGSVIGTSSPRRAAQLLARWPGLRIREIRGNVDTRLGKQRAGDYDGIVLAAAGLIRLGRTADIAAFFALDEMVPAAGQGVIAIEILGDRGDLREMLRAVNHEPSATVATIERAILQRFGTRLDCYSPIAVHAAFNRDVIEVRAFLSDLEGRDAIRLQRKGTDPAELVDWFAAELLRRGAAGLLEKTRAR